MRRYNGDIRSQAFSYRDEVIRLVWETQSCSLQEKKTILRQIYQNPLLLRYYRFQRTLKKLTRQALLQHFSSPSSPPQPPADLGQYILDRVFGSSSNSTSTELSS